MSPSRNPYWADPIPGYYLRVLLGNLIPGPSLQAPLLGNPTSPSLTAPLLGNLTTESWSPDTACLVHSLGYSLAPSVPLLPSPHCLWVAPKHHGWAVKASGELEPALTRLLPSFPNPYDLPPFLTLTLTSPLLPKFVPTFLVGFVLYRPVHHFAHQRRQAGQLVPSIAASPNRGPLTVIRHHRWLLVFMTRGCRQIIPVAHALSCLTQSVFVPRGFSCDSTHSWCPLSFATHLTSLCNPSHVPLPNPFFPAFRLRGCGSPAPG